MLSYCHSSTWERATLDFSCKQDKIPPAITLWHHRDSHHKENLCDCISAPSHINTQGQPSMWFGESWGRHFIHSELKWDKRHPPSKLSCFQKQLHDFQRHHSPQYISTSHMSLGESSLSGEPQFPAHSSLATENIKIHYTHTLLHCS